MEINKMIGTRIRSRRKELGLTINDISITTKISKGNLSIIETGKSLPTSNALIALSSVLDCSIDWILTGTIWRTNNIPKSELEDSKLELSDYEELMLFMLRELSTTDKKDVKEYVKSKIKTVSNEGLSSTSKNGKRNTRDDAVIA